MGKIQLVAWVFFILINSSAWSQGLLDFADPCVKGTESFKSTSQALRERSDAVIKNWDDLQDPPSELIPLYKEAIKLGLYNSWMSNPQTAPLIQMMIQANPKFDPKAFFFESVYPTAITPEQEKDFIRGLFKADYGTKLRPQLLANRQTLENQIQEQKQMLDDSCKNGEFDKVFRATIGNFAGIIASNFAASANERGDFAKAVRATSGISLTDIQQFGILGGPNSELNKALDNALGNSDVKKVITGLATGLNPGSWRLELPKIDLPQLPKAPEIRIPVPKIDLPQLPSCCRF